MTHYCFTVDDNIRFLKEITETCPQSIFDHPYLAMYQRMHQAFGVKVQLNLFYRMDGFDLSQMTDRFYHEWEENSHWLKLSFHSDHEVSKPYLVSGYEEVFEDCKKVNDQIVRFASNSALAKTTTIHSCELTTEGLRALADHKVLGLLGVFLELNRLKTSYGIGEADARILRGGEIVNLDGMYFAAIDVILNQYHKEEILQMLTDRKEQESIRVMIHEQYFYPDYRNYQPDFEEKLNATFAFFKKHGYQTAFFEELI